MRVPGCGYFAATPVAGHRLDRQFSASALAAVDQAIGANRPTRGQQYQPKHDTHPCIHLLEKRDPKQRAVLLELPLAGNGMAVKYGHGMRLRACLADS